MDGVASFLTRLAFLLLSALLLLKCEAKSAGSPKNTKKQCIAVEADSFMELVDKSQAFVDKTLFIKDFLEAKLVPHNKGRAAPNSTDVIRVSYPPKFGKTMNMKMLEDFLQMEVDESGNQINPKDTAAYKLFAFGTTASGHDISLNIARHRNIIETYAAQHPVIYVSLKNATGSTCNEIVAGIKRAVAETFKKHAYVTKILQNALKNESASDEVKKKVRDDLEKFQAILSPTSDAYCALNSLDLLSRVLHQHFGKKVYLLIDDHDQPIESLLTQAANLNEFKRAQDYLFYFLEDSHNRWQDAHFEKSLIHGVLRLAYIEEDAHHSSLKYFAEFSVLRNKFANYYGFNQNEVSVLFDECGIKPAQAFNVEQWFKGYTVRDTSYVDVYNPYDLAKFLHHGTMSNFWVHSGAVPFAPFVLKSKRVESFVISLFNKETVELDSDDLGCSAAQLHELATVLNPKSTSPLLNEYQAHIYYELLLMTGYLTLDNPCKSLDTAHVRMPNEEIASEMANLMIQHYKDTYTITDVVLNLLAEELKRLLKGKDSDMSRKSLEVFFSSFPEFTLKTNSSNGLKENQEVINSAFNVLTLIVKGIYHFNCEIYLLKDGDKGSASPKLRPNIVLNFKRSKIVIIIQLTFNATSAKAVAFAEKYLKVSIDHHKNIGLVGLMGINVFPNKTVDVKEFWGEMKKQTV